MFASDFAHAPHHADASSTNPTHRRSVFCLALALARALETAGGRRTRAIARHAIPTGLRLDSFIHSRFVFKPPCTQTRPSRKVLRRHEQPPRRRPARRAGAPVSSYSANLTQSRAPRGALDFLIIICMFVLFDVICRHRCFHSSIEDPREPAGAFLLLSPFAPACPAFSGGGSSDVCHLYPCPSRSTAPHWMKTVAFEM